MQTSASVLSDREQILHHIHGLFKAFMQEDLESIRKGHTSDWKGFQVESRHLVRGIDQYMEAAKVALQSFTGTRYEFLDLDVEVHGDLAVVFYLSRYWFRKSGEEKSILLRSVDIYRREPDGWNQCGSNICTMPDLPCE
jgi:ketosteroid isomerase-like protein